MLQCWKQKPSDRPSFSQLLDLLQSKEPSSPTKKKPLKDMTVNEVGDWVKNRRSAYLYFVSFGGKFSIDFT
jgi:hypothetical protein